MGSAVRFFEKDFVTDIFDRAESVPGRVEMWEHAIRKSMNSSEDINSMEDAISVFENSGRLKNSGHTPEIIKRVCLEKSKG